MFFTQVSQDKEEGGQIARGVGYCLCYVRLPNYIEALIAERVELFRIGDLCDDVGSIRVSDVALGEFVGNAPTKDIRLLVGSDQLVFPLVAISLGQDFFHALTTPSPVFFLLLSTSSLNSSLPLCPPEYLAVSLTALLWSAITGNENLSEQSLWRGRTVCGQLCRYLLIGGGFGAKKIPGVFVVVHTLFGDAFRKKSFGSTVSVLRVRDSVQR